MKRTTWMRRALLALPGLWLCGAGRAASDPNDEDVGSSSAALSLAPNKSAPPPSKVSRFRGEFVIHNPTGFNVGYSVRWGDGAWKSYTVSPRHLRRHWHVLDGNGRAPRPQLQFDKVANDHKVTTKTYDMRFGRVGSTPQGTPVNQAIDYEFVAKGNLIDMVQR